MSRFSYHGKVVLVTGGSGGIGREICRRFAAAGADVWVAYGSGSEAAEETLSRMAEAGRGTPYKGRKVQVSLLDADSVEAMVNRVADESGRIDLVVNNAGIFERHPPMETSFEDWQTAWGRTLGINLQGPANVCHRAAAVMKRQGGGRIVNITSRGAFRGEPECPAYGASKAGLNSLSQSLALALAPHGIQVFAVAPGFVETAMARPYLTGEMADAIRNQSPLGRVAKVGDVAYWVLCLADDDAEFATGTIIDVNGASYLRS